MVQAPRVAQGNLESHRRKCWKQAHPDFGPGNRVPNFQPLAFSVGPHHLLACRIWLWNRVPMPFPFSHLAELAGAGWKQAQLARLRVQIEPPQVFWLCLGSPRELGGHQLVRHLPASAAFLRQLKHILWLSCSETIPVLFGKYSVMVFLPSVLRNTPASSSLPVGTCKLNEQRPW